MLTTLAALPARPQSPLADEPFDRWLNPDGEATAEFRRLPGGYHVRFPTQADYAIALDTMRVEATPDEGTRPEVVESLWRNSVEPLVGNYLGGLNLHGSAVATPAGAVAFLGLSRSGKTTLAGGFARAGHPFLTEDVLELVRDGTRYMVQPQRPVLRLFHDSAEFLLGQEPGWADAETKQELVAGGSLPCASEPAPLAAICLLGQGETETISMEPLGAGEALRHVIRHAFVLDVEDRKRLAAHFARLGELAAQVPCHALDYPRRYAQLPEVIGAILSRVERGA